mgnify:CR=1 FL=1
MIKAKKTTSFEKAIQQHKIKCNGDIHFYNATSNIYRDRRKYVKIYICSKCNTKFYNS